MASTLTFSNLTLFGSCILFVYLFQIDPEGGEEVCTAGAAAAGGGKAKEAEDNSGAAVPSGPAGRGQCAAGPEAGSRRLTTADGCRTCSVWWVLQASGARPWPKRQVGQRHWYLGEVEMHKTCFHFLTRATIQPYNLSLHLQVGWPVWRSICAPLGPAGRERQGCGWDNM